MSQEKVDKFIELFKSMEAKERKEAMTWVCTFYPSLLCDALEKLSKCICKGKKKYGR